MGVTIKYYNNKHTMADAAPVKKVVKAKKVAKPAAHPPFKTMILTAIKALKERGGSSRQAILKYVVANNKVDAAKAAGPLKLALRKALAAGTIVKAKAAGKGAGKFKAGKVEKPKKAKKAKKPKAKKPAKKAASPLRKLPRSPLRKLPRSPQRKQLRSLPRRPPPRRSKSYKTFRWYLNCK